MYRVRPTPDECVEAITVMIEGYGVRTFFLFVEQAKQILRSESDETDDPERSIHGHT